MSSIAARAGGSGSGGGGGGAASGSKAAMMTPQPSSSPPPHPPALPSISEQVFASSLALAISLSPNDVPDGADAGADLVYYTTVRRNTYLPMILREVRECLVDLVLGDGDGVKDDEMWFEYRGVPLKWHWPVGLLYDHTTSNLAPTAVDGARHSRGSRGSGQDWSQSHSSQPRPPLPPPAPVPWSIILHIKNLPHAKLPPLSSNSTAPPTAPALDAIGTCLEAVKQSYMASLKEADFVRNGNTKKVNALRKSDQDGIWEAVQRGDFALYSSVMVKILPPASTYDAGAGAGDATTSASAPPAFDPPQPAPTPPPPTPPPPPSSSSMVPSRGSSLLPPGRNASSTSLLTPGVNTVGLGSSGNEQQHADAAAASEASASASTSTTPTPASVPPPGTLRGTGLPGLKSIPMRFILQGGTILQEGVPPIGEDGRPMTLGVVLHTLFPALFPVAATAATTGATPSFSLGLDFMASDVGAGAGADAGGSTATAAPAPAAPPSISHIDPLAVPIMQGIRVPLASTMLYLNRCLAGADGWVTVVLLLLPVGDSAQ